MISNWIETLLAFLFSSSRKIHLCYKDEPKVPNLSKSVIFLRLQFPTLSQISTSEASVRLVFVLIQIRKKISGPRLEPRDGSTEVAPRFRERWATLCANVRPSSEHLSLLASDSFLNRKLSLSDEPDRNLDSSSCSVDLAPGQIFLLVPIPWSPPTS